MLTLAEIGEAVSGDLALVRAEIGRCVERQPREVRESLGYYFSSGGKCLRPLLALLCARAATGGPLSPARLRRVTLFAAAVELAHNASLVHDDIMDGDRYRHGMQALHAKYGKSCAVLLGDVLHSAVFDLLGRSGDRRAVLLMTGTIRDMCYGQLLDVRRARRTAKDYATIIRCKTGKLMAAACFGGAAMSGAALGEEALRMAGEYGMRVGMLYQMVDDYQDGDAGVPLALPEIERVGRASRRYLKAFGDSRYRDSLHALIDHFISLARG